jgi:DNA adenine methylase
MKPFLKWAGGKTKLVPQIRALMPKTYKLYIEPFVGGGTLFFDVEPKKAILNDANKKLIECYRTLRSEPLAVIAILKLRARAHSEKLFYAVRARNFEHGSREQRAADFIYINKTCFNGLFRENKKGEFNTPGGEHEAFTPDVENLHACSLALDAATLTPIDFKEVIDTASAGDFVYCDPPYAPLTATANFTGYTAKGFGPEDQVRLRDACLRAKRRGVSIVISNSDCDLVRSLYKKGFAMHPVMAARPINSVGSKRTKVKEWLIT